jgi:hypothetical protein
MTSETVVFCGQRWNSVSAHVGLNPYWFSYEFEQWLQENISGHYEVKYSIMPNLRAWISFKEEKDELIFKMSEFH